MRSYELGETRRRGAARRDARRRARRVRRRHGRLGLGQVDVHEHPRLPRSPDARQLPPRRARRGRALRRRARRDPQPRDRLRLPELQPVPRTSALENVELPLFYGDVAPAEQRERARAALRAVGLARSRGTTCRASSRAASSSASRSPARSSTGRCSCSPTSRPATSTRRPATRSWRSSSSLNREAGITIVLVTHEPDIATLRRAA